MLPYPGQRQLIPGPPRRQQRFGLFPQVGEVRAIRDAKIDMSEDLRGDARWEAGAQRVGRTVADRCRYPGSTAVPAGRSATHLAIAVYER
jgi:hypothetical protein